MVFQQFNVGVGEGLFEQGGMHGLAGGICAVNDAAMAVATFLSEVVMAVIAAGEINAQAHQPFNGCFATCNSKARLGDGTKPAPATRVSATWDSMLSSSSNTAAIPPCACQVEPSVNLPLLSTLTLHTCANLRARGMRPAAPLPMTNTSL